MQKFNWNADCCTITSVAVYLSGAQIQRTGHLTLPVGECHVTLERLPAGLLPDSIQASLGEGGEILSLEHRVDYLMETDVKESVQTLWDEHETLQNELAEREAMLQVCLEQEEMLRANRCMAGADTGLKASELREGVQFFRESMEDIQLRRLGLDKEKTRLQRKIQRLEEHLGGLGAGNQRPVSEVVLHISMTQGGEIPLHLTYFTPDAGWVPAYDIRAKDTQSPIRVSSKARISQNTNEDWNGVALTVSTGSPSGNATCPSLTPWSLDIQQPHRGTTKAGMYQSFNAASVHKSVRLSEGADVEYTMDTPMAPSPAEPPRPIGADVDHSLTTVDYHIPLPCTVLSGQGEQMVEMTAQHIPAKFLYRSVRKLDKAVYLMAFVEDYAQLNLIAGEANIFLGSQYVGKTFIDPRRGEEQIDLSLGADQSVVVTRQKGKCFTAGGLGGNRKVTREWELTARNLKDQPIRIQLHDQVPVSANKQIQVEVTEISGAAHDKDTGMLKWEFDLQPSEMKSVKVRYVVIHPKNMVVYLD